MGLIVMRNVTDSGKMLRQGKYNAFTTINELMTGEEMLRRSVMGMQGDEQKGYIRRLPISITNGENSVVRVSD